MTYPNLNENKIEENIFLDMTVPELQNYFQKALKRLPHRNREIVNEADLGFMIDPSVTNSLPIMTAMVHHHRHIFEFLEALQDSKVLKIDGTTFSMVTELIIKELNMEENHENGMSVMQCLALFMISQKDILYLPSTRQSRARLEKAKLDFQHGFEMEN